MPSLRVHRNSEHLCTAGSDDVWTFSASVWGDVFGPEAAMVAVTGNALPSADTPGKFLIWECPVALARGDVIEMFFDAASMSYPLPIALRDDAGSSSEAKSPWSSRPTEREIASLESREAGNAGIHFSVRIGDFTAEVVPDTSRQHVSLHILWQERRPEYIRAALSMTSLREITARLDGEQLFSGELPFGSNLSFAIAT